MRTPIVAIVGRPNVGKSTLFNRLIGERKALVLDEPGITRDRNYGRSDAWGTEFIAIDTGGFEPDSDEGMLPAMREQAQLAVEEADITIFLVDGREGLTTTDEQVFEILRSSDRPVLVGVNKIEGSRQHPETLEFYALGCEKLFLMSAEHGLGISELLDELHELLPTPEPVEEAFEGDEVPSRTRIAVIGRPNAGKSTLINRLLGQDRLIVSSVAGTTRDSIDSDFEIGDREYTIVDTVGIRRRKSVSLAVEKFGVIKAMQSIERSHIAILMVDTTEGGTLSDQDARIANMAVKAGRALIIVMNKWDVVEKDHRTADALRKEIEASKQSLAYAPILFVSAMTGQRVHKVMQLVDRVVDNWRRRVPTSELNRWFESTRERRPPPLYKKRAVKLYYVTQARSAPPTFVLQSNMPASGVPEAYLRYLKNQLRESYDFVGTPIRLVIRQRTSRFKPGES